MNAVSNSETNLTEGGSDTDTIPDELPEYYEPISNLDEEDSFSYNDQDLVNGCLENGITYLDLNNEEDEEERMREAVQRAFREDESRRRAPLTPENTVRVMEAMRGISLPGLAPHWAADDRWMDELARIRRPPASSS
ncbi:uncharacterized protein LOC143567038 [Bidens hawaiensis]|uniref:uncharacterized protein LOC143567038 n=1 Tax=Bidens hawaiensis TaxID=980011 RepID=UPI00404B75C5